MRYVYRFPGHKQVRGPVEARSEQEARRKIRKTYKRSQLPPGTEIKRIPDRRRDAQGHFAKEAESWKDL